MNFNQLIHFCTVLCSLLLFVHCCWIVFFFFFDLVYRLFLLSRILPAVELSMNEVIFRYYKRTRENVHQSSKVEKKEVNSSKHSVLMPKRSDD